MLKNIIFISFIFLNIFQGIVYGMGETLHISQIIEEKLKKLYEHDKSDTARLYRFFNFHLIWLNEEGKWSKRAKNLLKTVKSADEESLSTREYSVLETLMKNNVDAQEGALLKADKQATNLFLAYIKDLFLGRLRHLGLSSKRLISTNHFDVIEHVTSLFKKDMSGDFLSKMTIDLEGYQRLKKLLAQYRKAENEKTWPHMPEGEVLKLTQSPMKSSRVQILRKILSAQGYLKSTDKMSQIYDADLEAAVKNFQKHHVIKEDGVIGSETLQMLNLSHQDQVDRILLAMEKWRWLPKEMGDRFIIVNIPAFCLTTFQNGKKDFDMKIIVGRQYRKTPTFSSEIYAVRFNPSWHVPNSIFRKDKLPKILNDPSYVSQKGFVVYDASSGQRLNPQNVDWESGDIRLVQPPGVHNALGKIRFTLKTTDSVYLHGTPEKYLFDKDKRSFSSGCIRVEDPQKLALYVFNDKQNWPLEKIERESAGEQTKNIPLEHPVPVHIVYLTVWVDDNGIPYFADDIYNRDRGLLEQLKQIQYPGYIAQISVEELLREETEEPSEEPVFANGAAPSPQPSDNLIPPSMDSSRGEKFGAESSIQPYGLY